MFGKVQLANFDNVVIKPPQGAASAMAFLENIELVGVQYKVISYLGEQEVHGTIYYFTAEQTRITNPIVRRVVRVGVCECDGDYKLLDKSILEILA